MDPRLAKFLLTSGIFILIMSIWVLPQLESGSPEYVAGLTALFISLIFIVYVAVDVRRQARL